MTNFSLVQHHDYTFADIDNMYPFEKKVYIDLINNEMKKKQHVAAPEEVIRGMEPQFK